MGTPSPRLPFLSCILHAGFLISALVHFERRSSLVNQRSRPPLVVRRCAGPFRRAQSAPGHRLQLSVRLTDPSPPPPVRREPSNRCASRRKRDCRRTESGARKKGANLLRRWPCSLRLHGPRPDHVMERACESLQEGGLPRVEVRVRTRGIDGCLVGMHCGTCESVAEAVCDATWPGVCHGPMNEKHSADGRRWRGGEGEGEATFVASERAELLYM